MYINKVLVTGSGLTSSGISQACAQAGSWSVNKFKVKGGHFGRKTGKGRYEHVAKDKRR